MFYHLGGEKTTGRGEEGSPLVSGARSTRGLRRPSLDARSWEITLNGLACWREA